MDVATFEDLIDRLGDDLSRWPDDQRLAAVQLLTVSVEAKALHEEASTLRQALATPTVRAPQGLVDRIVTAAAKLPREHSLPGAEPNDAPDSGEPAQQGKVLPALLLALCLLSALASSALMLDEPGWVVGRLL